MQEKVACPHCGSLYSLVMSQGSKRGHHDKKRGGFIRWRQCLDCQEPYPTSETAIVGKFHNI